MSRPRLSVCLVTQDMAHFLPFALDSVRDVADEIVAVDSFSSDGTVELLQKEPKVKLFQREFAGHFGEQKNFAIDQASGDWVLIIDSDEILGDRMRREIPALVTSRRYTHFKFARYWVVEGPPWVYVRSEAHYPDFQLRLFRNLPVFRYTRGKVVHTHFPREGRGEGKKMKRSHIFHFDFMLKDRAAREAKYQRYLRLEPASEKTSVMYLYEDFDYAGKRCKESLTAPALNVKVFEASA